MGAVSKIKKPRRFKWRWRILLALVLYALFGFVVLPAIIKWQALKQLPALTHRQAEIKQVRFNPFSLALTIRGFALKETNGDVFASFDEFHINFQPVASLFRWAIVLKDISVKSPFAQATRQADGSFNFANLILPATNTPAAPKTNQPPGQLPRVVIYRFMVTNGAVAIDDLDRREPFHTKFSPINLDLTNLSTIRDRNSPYSFIARTGEGESFAWAGFVTVNPVRSSGKFRLGGIDLKKYSPYAHDYARFNFAGGLLDVAADYLLDASTNVLDVEVSNAAVHLTKLVLKSADSNETLISIPVFSITDTEASLPRQTARVGRIQSADGSLLIRRETNGLINLLSMLILPTNAAAASVSSNAAAASVRVSNAPSWTARIDEIVFTNYTFRIEDEVPGQPAAFDIDQFALDLKGVSNITNAPVGTTVSLRFASNGFINVNGSATLMPPTADLQLQLTNLDLRPLQPYAHEQVKLAITGGALDMTGHAKLNAPGATPLANFEGDVAINKFGTTDDVLFKDFTTWDALHVSGIKAEVQPLQLRVDEVKFTGLNASVVIGPDRRMNLQTILRSQPGSTNTSSNGAVAVTASNAAPAVPVVLPNVALSNFVLVNAAIHFIDQSLDPHCGFDVQQFGGTISGLSSDPKSTATMDIRGQVDARSPFAVTGKLNPLSSNMLVDVAVAFTNTELTAFSTYAEKYVGRPLQKGKFSFAVHYDIKDRALNAQNNFFVDQLTLGPKNNSPDATSLPVKLAIALLKDREGRIKLDVPVTGRIDDPKFSPWPVIWHVVDNLLVKAATSPFSLLGAAFGGGEELSYVNFAPGGAGIPDAETNKLETLAKALYERPELTVEISGAADPTMERDALARQKVEMQLKTLWLQEQSQSGKPGLSIDKVQLEPAEHDRLLRKHHKAVIGEYVPTPIPTNAAGEADTNSIAARLAALPPPASREHGASLLTARGTGPAPSARAAAGGRSAVSPAGQAQPAKPLTREELELADMEDQLVKKMTVTDDDWRQLMQQRANQVQAYLLKTGKVGAERLFVIAPKPVDTVAKAGPKATLSLD